MAGARHILSIVIPALNEEEAIGQTIARCVAARETIVDTGHVEAVEIIVVSDGSTDRTEQIASSFPEVETLVFERNRGYGAAIKCGFEHGRGDWVGFLDADGTCDPRIFADLCSALETKNADIALGSRMGADSEMPAVRRIGNTLFAWLLGLLSRVRVDDTASGMRVIRRSALERLYPLPDGLHFTPAMSAGALLSGDLSIVEVPMPYAERVGRSKLSVLRDGVRFLRVILQAATCYRPARPLLLAAGPLAAVALALGAVPTLHYLRHARLEEWMIYRVLLASLATTGVVLLLAASVVADRIAAIAHDRAPDAGGVGGLVARLFTPRARWLGGLLLGAGALASAYPGIAQYLSTGMVELHWSRAVLASLLLVLAAQLGLTTFLLNMLDLIHGRRVPFEIRPPDRIHPSQPRR